MDKGSSTMQSLKSIWTRLSAGAWLAASLALLAGCQRGEKAQSAAAAPSSVSTRMNRGVKEGPATSVRTSIGFRSRRYLDEHFAKHGREFTGMSKAEYLLAAQTLRDSPAGGDIEELVRGDGSASRFDKASGAFIAFNRDGTIRTFFKPNDGERYFRRQAQRSH